MTGVYLSRLSKTDHPWGIGVAMPRRQVQSRFSGTPKPTKCRRLSLSGSASAHSMKTYQAGISVSSGIVISCHGFNRIRINLTYAKRMGEL